MTTQIKTLSSNSSDDTMNYITRVADESDRAMLYTVSAGHFIVDMCQGTVPVMLPFLLTRMHLDYAQAGLVVTAAYLTSSVTQPLFGLIKVSLIQRFAMPVGVLLACLLLALAGQTHSYPLLVSAVILSSAGVAMYHPEAAATAYRAAGTANPSRGMSVFAMCGSVGFTFGPLIFGPTFALIGLRGALLLLLPAVALPLLLLRFSAHPAPLPGSARKASATTPANAVRAMTLLVAVVALSRWAMSGTMTFLPLYFTRYLALSPGIGNRAMIAFQVGGDVGTFVCGLLVARFGTRPTLLAGMLASAPLILAFPHTTGIATLVLLFLANFMLAQTVLSTTLLGQEFLPNNKALAASLTLGFGTGLGGLGVSLLGHVADLHGVPAALVYVGIAPALGAILGLLLFSGRLASCSNQAL